ncbi:hypothetical protein BV25DRAFT_1922341 [Artomyces pyxidatus]|uniref:Uncharacterized protein n=1 Tax=Artomyces pyxidatus TaxID=48021 RepID=A0ACB8SED2_9AGAM|nr:hypothetical protein BV25DRAFT_1922341 [Artomyces pyxidatus]
MSLIRRSPNRGFKLRERLNRRSLASFPHIHTPPPPMQHPNDSTTAKSGAPLMVPALNTPPDPEGMAIDGPASDAVPPPTAEAATSTTELGAPPTFGVEAVPGLPLTGQPYWCWSKRTLAILHSHGCAICESYSRHLDDGSASWRYAARSQDAAFDAAFQEGRQRAMAHSAEAFQLAMEETDGLNNEIVRQQRRVSRRDEELNQLRAETARLNDQLSAAALEADTLRKELADVQHRLDVSSQEVAWLEGALDDDDVSSIDADSKLLCQS